MASVARVEAPVTSVVTASEWTEVGWADVCHRVRVLTLTTGARRRTYYESSQGAVYAACRRCAGSGTVEIHKNVLGGRCFTCDGHGLGSLMAAGVSDAIKRERRGWLAARRREQAAAAMAATKADEGARWQAGQQELVAALAELVAADQAAPGRSALPMDLYELAYRVHRGEALSDRQTALAAVLVADRAAEVVARSQLRHAGMVGTVVTISGTVVTALSVGSRYGRSRLIVVEGDGADIGITVKAFATSDAAWAIERAARVCVSGVVKSHEEYEGIPQTVLSRPEFIDAR